MFTLAHLSDVHLSPLPSVSLPDLLSKRFIGYLSWHLRRKSIHESAILQAVINDIKTRAPDHVALTGDLINISLLKEFDQATDWLSSFGAPDWISFVPGNHDTYVKLPWEPGLAKWSGHMTGDLNMPSTRLSGNIAMAFPYVRQRKNIALVGLSSAINARWNKAGGTLGTRQLEALEQTLINLHQRGFYRIIMIHHPPLPGQAIDRKALSDASELKQVLQTAGAELVLHGHNHKDMHARLETATGMAHIFGVPSASVKKTSNKPAAAWYQYQIRRNKGEWQTDIEIRSFDDHSGSMITTSKFSLDV